MYREKQLKKRDEYLKATKWRWALRWQECGMCNKEFKWEPYWLLKVYEEYAIGYGIAVDIDQYFLCRNCAPTKKDAAKIWRQEKVADE
ncbi:hypothetical protein M0R19_05340 [Candidatus Pacearchaeota archaeon]|jgi:hypothetical protein|nr:hypothetical protein [Candidatus Pacearchaeota archaeon]